MNKPDIRLARLVVFFFDVGFNHIEQTLVARTVALRGDVLGFEDDYYLIVLV